MNVSKGDLAYITGCTVQFEYNGRVVSVVEESDPPCDIAAIKFGCTWWEVTANFAAAAMSDNGLKSIPAGASFLLPDSLLRRIAGPSVVTETETDQPAEVTA